MIKKSLQGQIQTKVCTNITLITTPPPPPHPLSDIDCMAQIWGLKVIQPFLLVLYETTLSIWMTSQTDFFSYRPKNSHLPGRKIKYQLNTKMINWSIDWRIVNSFLVPHNLSPQFISWNVMWDPVSYKLVSYKKMSLFVWFWQQHNHIQRQILFHYRVTVTFNCWRKK